jgi:RNA polymerase sigma-70 factor (ECF subfamily)
MVMMTDDDVRDAPILGFDDAYQRWYADVFRYVRRRVGDDLAPDVTMDAFAVAWRRRDDLLSADVPLAWLYGVARRCVANARRSRSRSRALADRAAAMATDAVPDGSAEVVDALSRLGDADREVLMLSAWEGLSGEEMAVVLDITPGAARKRLSRARGRLAAALEGDTNA